MNIARRLLLVLSEVTLLAFLALLFLDPNRVIDVANQIQTLQFGFRLAFVVLLAAVTFALIGFQLWSANKQTGVEGLVVGRKQRTETIASLTVESVETRLQQRLAHVPDVAAVRVNALPVDGKAEVSVDVIVQRTDLSIAKKQKQIEDVLRSVLKDQMDLQLASPPKIRIHLDGKQENLDAALDDRMQRLSRSRDS